MQKSLPVDQVVKCGSNNETLVLAPEAKLQLIDILSRICQNYIHLNNLNRYREAPDELSKKPFNIPRLRHGHGISRLCFDPH
jgi:hypothetical protein